MSGRNSGGQIRVVLTPAERRQYMRWWLVKSGLSRAELRRIAMGLGFGTDPEENRTATHISVAETSST